MAKNGKTFGEREVAVILEDIESKFRIFDEGLSGLREKVDGIMVQLAKNTEDTALIKFIAKDVKDIKTDVKSIKASLDDFDKRISSLETLSK